ncbi:MAG: DoxX family protein [Vicinamibacterales bacterium]
MTSPLGRLEPLAYNLLRIVAGFVFILHGMQKFGFLGGTAVSLTSLIGLAAIIEVVGGTLIALGLFTVPAAFIASGEMAYAYFFSHLPRGFWPVQNGGEPAILYCFIFLFVASRGPGGISIDALLRKRR